MRKETRDWMHIIIDGVFNHCSWYFPQFEDVVQKGKDSLYKDWFYDLEFSVRRPHTEEEIPGYACFAYERKMPKLNTANIHVQDYFARVGRYWVEEFQVDGWRLDVANEVDKGFWRKFRAAVRSADPVMNYDFKKHCRDFFALQKTKADGFVWRRVCRAYFTGTSAESAVYARTSTGELCRGGRRTQRRSSL